MREGDLGELVWDAGAVGPAVDERHSLVEVAAGLVLAMKAEDGRAAESSDRELPGRRI